MCKCSTKHVLIIVEIVIFCFEHSLCHNIENNTIIFVLVQWQKSTSGEILNFALLNLFTFQVNFYYFSSIGLPCYIMFTLRLSVTISPHLNFDVLFSVPTRMLPYVEFCWSLSLFSTCPQPFLQGIHWTCKALQNDSTPGKFLEICDFR